MSSPEGNPLHNALQQVSLLLPHCTIQGFSISGLSTYIQIPEFDLCFDMGECPLSAIGLNHVFLSHAHGDHSRCLMRHESLRRMMGVEKPAAYYMPDMILDAAKEWIRAEAAFEGVRNGKFTYPNLIGVPCGNEWMPLQYRKDLVLRSFPVNHSIPSVGFTVATTKQKLLDELVDAGREEILRRKAAGIPITRTVVEPRFTYIGDCTGDSLLEQEHIWDSEVLFLECTFLDPDEELMARKKGHTHILELAQALETMGDRVRSKHIVLKHFSMKYSKRHIIHRINECIPERFRDRVLLLI